MNLVKTIQEAVKSKNIIVGYSKSIRAIKLSRPKLLVIAKNTPESMKEELKHNASISGIRVEIFDGTSNELGIILGKPFPVTTLVIK